jgi:hypothetical protein
VVLAGALTLGGLSGAGSLVVVGTRALLFFGA